MPRGEFIRACSLIEQALRPSVRAAVVDDASDAANLAGALSRVAESMRSHTWLRGESAVDLRTPVRELDAITRREGFHVLNDWDGKAQHVNDDIIPVEVLTYLAGKRGAEPVDRAAIAILLDYYYVHLLSLLTVRLWDEDDPDDNLDRVNRLLDCLQEAGGSGQKFADDAETLMLVATSHYERDESGFDRLLGRVGGLSARHRARIALGHASSMGCHLRFGFEAQCGRDMVALRDDNVADYPWLCFALAGAIEEYDRLRQSGTAVTDRRPVVEALLNGLTPDPRAFTAQPPRSLSRSERDRSRFRDLFFAYRADLLDEFEECRPSAGAYSPLAFYFNFRTTC